MCVSVCRAVSSQENPGACAGVCWKREAKLGAGWVAQRGGETSEHSSRGQLFNPE